MIRRKMLEIFISTGWAANVVIDGDKVSYETPRGTLVRATLVG